MRAASLDKIIFNNPILLFIIIVVVVIISPPSMSSLSSAKLHNACGHDIKRHVTIFIKSEVKLKWRRQEIKLQTIYSPTSSMIFCSASLAWRSIKIYARFYDTSRDFMKGNFFSEIPNILFPGIFHSCHSPEIWYFFDDDARFCN